MQYKKESGAVSTDRSGYWYLCGRGSGRHPIGPGIHHLQEEEILYEAKCLLALRCDHHQRR